MSNSVDDTTCCPVLELRQYVLHPGQRDTLIALFDREFVETQEAAGMRVIAQFRDFDRPDVFTWLRGFADMPSRAAALAAFYDGAVWAAHRNAANATMISSDDVRLLRPARPGSGFLLRGAHRPDLNATAIVPLLFVATIYSVTVPSGRFAEFFDRSMTPELVSSGARPIAVLETEPSVNNFPRLPVREGEHAFVWFARFSDVTAYDRHVSMLEASRHWREMVHSALDQQIERPAEILRLVPTSRSLLPA